MTDDEMVGWHHRLMDMSLGILQELVMDKEAWRAVIHVACPVFPSPLVEETVFSPQCIFASFLIDELTIGMSGLNLV